MDNPLIIADGEFKDIFHELITVSVDSSYRSALVSAAVFGWVYEKLRDADTPGNTGRVLRIGLSPTDYFKSGDKKLISKMVRLLCEAASASDHPLSETVLCTLKAARSSLIEDCDCNYIIAAIASTPQFTSELKQRLMGEVITAYLDTVMWTCCADQRRKNTEKEVAEQRDNPVIVMTTGAAKKVCLEEIKKQGAKARYFVYSINGRSEYIVAGTEKEDGTCHKIPESWVQYLDKAPALNELWFLVGVKKITTNLNSALFTSEGTALAAAEYLANSK